MLAHPEGEDLIFAGFFVDISPRRFQLFVQFFELGAGIPAESVRHRIVLCKVVKLEYLAEFLDKYFEQVLLVRLLLSPDQGSDPNQPVIEFYARGRHRSTASRRVLMLSKPALHCVPSS
jgi:hypothetical protein